jgi:hypothetical protein
VDDVPGEFTVAVPFDAVPDLEYQGLAHALPVLRGAAFDAVVTVGTDAATLVSLLQAPDAIRAFAVWVRGRCGRSGERIELSARSGGRDIYLKVDGHIEADVIADFLAAALRDASSKGEAPRR